MRSLYEKMRKKENVEVELKKSLAEKECLLNDEKEKVLTFVFLYLRDGNCSTKKSCLISPFL